MNDINVCIGEVKVARNGETLKAILGSCVGIGFLWKQKGICGLAHCLLAESPEKTFAIDGRFINQAIPSLIALMRIQPEDIPQIEVIVVGGGNMTQSDSKDPDKHLGSNNFRVAERELRNLGFNPIQSDRAGKEGRKITINSKECTYLIERIPRLSQAS